MLDSFPDTKLPAVSPSPGTSPQGVTIDGLLASIESDKVVDYLLDSRSAVKLAEWIVGELSLPENIAKPLVRLALKFLAKLLLSRTAQGGSWISQKVLDATIYSLEHLTHSQIILHAISKMLQRLNKDALAKAEMDALLSGATTVISAEAAARFSDDTQLALKQLGQIAELKTDIAGIATYMEGRLNPQPSLSLPLLDDTAQNRLRFAARHIPFLGRGEEMAQLNAFRDGVEQFSWGLVTGSGGLGKSRLALEFCLTAGTAWRVGFLSDRSTFTSWETWQPDQPALIVVDYVAMRAELIGRMLAQLNSRSDLECPVRVLLLERHKDEVWWKQMVPNTSEGLALAQSQFDADKFLAISKLERDALWEIVTTIVDVDKVDALNRQEVLDKLCEIDSEQRPLYAALVADALKAGRTLGGWDKERLFKDVIDREEQNYWLPAIPAGTSDTPALLERHKNLLAFMTMIGGLPLNKIDALPKSLELPKAKDLCKPLYQAMSGTQLTDLSWRKRQSVELQGLTPDPLGEFFTLSHLNERDVEEYSRSAWSILPQHSFNFTGFLERSLSDFAGHECLEYLIDISRHTPDGRITWALIQARRSLHCGITGALAEAGNLVEAIWQIASEYSKEPILRDLWARSVFNMIVHRRDAGDLDAASAYLCALEEVTHTYPNEAILRERWAGSALSMAHGYCVAGDLAVATKLSNELEKISRIYPAEPFLREQWAKSACDMVIFYSAENKLIVASGFLNALEKVIHIYANEQILLELWANAVVSMTNAYGKSGNLNPASVLLNALKKVSNTYPTNPLWRDEWAKSACNTILGLIEVGDLSAASLLLETLKKVTQTHTQQSILRQAWARSIENMIGAFCKAGDLNTPFDHLNDLEMLAQANPDEYVLRESWGRSACIMVLSYVERGDLTQANDLVDALEEVAKKYPDEPGLQELWTTMSTFRQSGYKDLDI